jgi:hypothetical protein
MTTRRKPNSGDPRKHPGDDMIIVVYPELPPVPDGWKGNELDDASEEMVAAFLQTHPITPKSETVTRDEFQRRMAGHPILDTLHAAGRRTRVITLLDITAIEQWWDTA